MNATLMLVADEDLVAYAATRLRTYLRQRDVLVVAAGGRSLTTLARTVAACRQQFPENRVFASCGPKRLTDLNMLDIDCLLVDWEQSTWSTIAGERPWNWEQSWTLSRTRVLGSLTRRPFGVVVTGAPLVNRSLQRYRWDFARLGREHDWVVVQTQGFVRRGTLGHALMKLAGQYNASGLETGQLAVEVALGDTENAVSPETAALATRTALETGIANVYLFGGNRAAGQLETYIRLVRRERLS